MELKNEMMEKCYKYTLDCTDDEATQLKKIAIERFKNDEKAQVEYAVISLLAEAVGMLDIDDKPKKTRKPRTKKT